MERSFGWVDVVLLLVVFVTTSSLIWMVNVLAGRIRIALSASKCINGVSEDSNPVVAKVRMGLIVVPIQWAVPIMLALVTPKNELLFISSIFGIFIVLVLLYFVPGIEREPVSESHLRLVESVGRAFQLAMVVCHVAKEIVG